MALWHQRDARWHVEERHDGSNVNGWCALNAGSTLGAHGFIGGHLGHMCAHSSGDASSCTGSCGVSHPELMPLHAHVAGQRHRHWEERNRVQWSRERLAALLTPMPATGLDVALAQRRHHPAQEPHRRGVRNATMSNLLCCFQRSAALHPTMGTLHAALQDAGKWPCVHFYAYAKHCLHSGRRVF